MRWRPRFSLRTLLLLTLLIGGAGVLYVKREPWQMAAVLKTEYPTVSQLQFSRSGRKLLAEIEWLSDTPLNHLVEWDCQTTKKLFDCKCRVRLNDDFTNIKFEGDDFICI